MPFDFSAVSAPFRMQPGLRRLAPGVPQLTPSRPGDGTLTEKLHVLQHWPMDALVAAPGFDAGAALAALCAQAAQEHPDAFAWDGRSAIQARWLGWGVREGRVQGDGPAPMAIAFVQHVTGTHLIDLLDDDHATGRLYFQVLTDAGLDHWGRYADRYVRIEGRWRFHERRVTLTPVPV